jgi:hypothetical protein
MMDDLKRESIGNSSRGWQKLSYISAARRADSVETTSSAAPACSNVAFPPGRQSRRRSSGVIGELVRGKRFALPDPRRRVKVIYPLEEVLLVPAGAPPALSRMMTAPELTATVMSNGTSAPRRIECVVQGLLDLVHGLFDQHQRPVIVLQFAASARVAPERARMASATICKSYCSCLFAHDWGASPALHMSRSSKFLAFERRVDWRKLSVLDIRNRMHNG